MADKHPVYARKLRMGMVGGGPGAFIGDVHRKAARMDGQIELVAGAFSSDPDKSRAQGEELYLDPSRTYASYTDMIAGETALDADRRIDFVSIVTPNHMHFSVARDFLRAGFNVVCDKPMTLTVAEARELRQVVEATGKIFVLTHNYTGYPMVKLARDMVRQGDLGQIIKIKVQYPQEWLIQPIEQDGAKQAEWRTDPNRSGAAGCMGDIGTHAENLVEYISGLKISRICADLTSFVAGRRLDDDGNCLLQFDNGAKGILSASQVSVGDENGLAIWVCGRDKSLEWHQENPNYLYVKAPNAPVQTWRRGNDYIAAKSAAAGRASRLPFGHPEGFLEAFANIYVNAAATMRAAIAGDQPDPLALDFPTVDDGMRGMLFIETVVKSARQGAVWLDMPTA